MSGVYVVALDPDITGPENIAWAFVDEMDATCIVRVLEREYGEGRAWYTFEPVAASLDDPDAREYFRARLGCTDRKLIRLLAAAESA